MKVSYLTPVYSNEKNRKAHLTHSNEQLPDVKIFSSLPVGCFSPVVLGVRTIKSDKFKQTTFKGNEEDEKLSNLSGLKAIARQAARESMEEIKPEVTEELKREVREELKSVLTQELGTFKTEIKQEIENRNNRLTDSVNNLNKSVGNLERKYNALSETVDQNDKNLTDKVLRDKKINKYLLATFFDRLNVCTNDDRTIDKSWVQIKVQENKVHTFDGYQKQGENK